MNNNIKHFLVAIRYSIKYFGLDDHGKIDESYLISYHGKLINHDRFQAQIDRGELIKYLHMNRVMLADISRLFDCKVSYNFDFPFIIAHYCDNLSNENVKSINAVPQPFDAPLLVIHNSSETPKFGGLNSDEFYRMKKAIEPVEDSKTRQKIIK